MTAKSSLPFLSPMFSPSPLVTFHTEKYNREHNVIHISRCTVKVCGKTEIEPRWTLNTTITLTWTAAYNLFTAWSFWSLRYLVILVFRLGWVGLSNFCNIT